MTVFPKSKFKFKRWGVVLFLIALIPFGVFQAIAEESEWTFWQERFNEMNSKKDSETAAPLKIKSVDITGQLPTGTYVSRMTGQNREQCITCHDGIEEISKAHPATFGCIVCHGGRGDTLSKEEAHSSLIFDPDAGTGRRNPSALSVAHLSCGQSGCHAGHSDDSRNSVDRVRKSMMGTLAGMISGLRYQWGAQESKEARFGMTPVKSASSNTSPKGAIEKLEGLPYFTPLHRSLGEATDTGTERRRVSHHIADYLLETQCKSCHLDGKPAAGKFRSQGCAACHFKYADDGVYQGMDPTIERLPGHAVKHQMVTLPPQSTCLQCHVEFPSMDLRNPLHKNLASAGKPLQDVHLKRGMECIDCHTQSDIMGDGTLYSKQFQAVEIRCSTCHGTPTHNPSIARITRADDPVVRLSGHYAGLNNQPGDWMVVSSRNRKLSNVKVINKNIVTFRKRTGEEHITPSIKGSKAHSIPGHQKRMSCTACHSRWVSECVDCSLTVTLNGTSSTPTKNATRPKSGYGSHKQTRTRLMVGPRGTIVPMRLRAGQTLTVLDSNSNPVPALNTDGDRMATYKNFAWVNPEGHAGSLSAEAVHPHSVTESVRGCADCHLSPTTLGLSEGILKIGNNPAGKRDWIADVVRRDKQGVPRTPHTESPVTLRGETIYGTHQPGARTFNQAEITRILKVGTCLSCHSQSDDSIYLNINKSYRYANTLKHHQQMDAMASSQP